MMKVAKWPEKESCSVHISIGGEGFVYIFVLLKKEKNR
jgi:hypothetical protein